MSKALFAVAILLQFIAFSKELDFLQFLRKKRSLSGQTMFQCKISIGNFIVSRYKLEQSWRIKLTAETLNTSMNEEIWNCTKYLGSTPQGVNESVCESGICYTFHFVTNDTRIYLQRTRHNGNLLPRLVLSSHSEQQPYSDLVMVLRYNYHRRLDTLLSASNTDESLSEKNRKLCAISNPERFQNAIVENLNS